MATIKKGTKRSKPASEEMVKKRKIASSDDGQNSSSSKNERDILSLPPELILKIFKYLPRTDLRKPVCKRWLRLSCDSSLWEKVTLMGKDIKVRHLMGVAKCDVKVLRLQNCKILLAPHWKGFGRVRLGELRKLYVFSTTIGGSILRKLLAPNLKVLHLDAETANVDSKIISNISELPHLEEFMILDLHFMNNFELNCRSFRRLKFLRLRFCKFQNVTVRRKLLRSCKKLTAFEWSGCGDITAEVFRDIQELENLYSLILGFCCASVESTLDAKSQFFSFRKLQLKSCRFDFKSLQMLLPRCSQLTSLNILGGDTITDEIFRLILNMEKACTFHFVCCNISLAKSILLTDIAHRKCVSKPHFLLEYCRFNGIDSFENFLFCSHVGYIEDIYVCNYKVRFPNCSYYQEDWIQVSLEANIIDVN